MWWQTSCKYSPIQARSRFKWAVELTSAIQYSLLRNCLSIKSSWFLNWFVNNWLIFHEICFFFAVREITSKRNCEVSHGSFDLNCVDRRHLINAIIHRRVSWVHKFFSIVNEKNPMTTVNWVRNVIKLYSKTESGLLSNRMNDYRLNMVNTWESRWLWINDNGPQDTSFKKIQWNSMACL